MPYFDLKSGDGKIDDLKAAVVSVLGYEKIQGVRMTDEELAGVYEKNIAEFGGDYTLESFVAAIKAGRG